MAHERFIAQVTKVHPGSTVAVGTRSEALEGQAVIGRDAECELRLDDATVSARHVRVGLAGGRFFVEALARNGTTFVQGDRLEPGRRIEVVTPRVWLQLGRVLLHVFPDPETVRFDEPLAIPDTAVRQADAPVFTFRRGPHRVDLWCRGQAMALFPSAVRALMRLCESAGQTVTYDDLELAVDPEAFQRAGGASLSQLVTYIRQMVDQAMDQGLIGEDELRRIVAAQGAQAGAEADAEAVDRRALLRSFIENVRGVGYRIRLTPGQVAFLG